MKGSMHIKIILIIPLLTFLYSCDKENDTEEPTHGIIEGTVTALEDGSPLEGVRITCFDANTNAPTGATQLTDTAGYYRIELVPGNYILKLSKLGFENIPSPGMTGLPLPVSIGASTTGDFQMAPSMLSNGGVISGRVQSEGSYKSGVLVVAENTDNANSSVTDADGYYYIVNVAPGNYSVAGWLAGYNSTLTTVSVDAGAEVMDVDLELSDDAQATVSGSITFLATQNIEVDVSLVHPMTKETIPGLITTTVNGIYSILNVPNGAFLGRASWKNDEKVVDPDWIVKNGEPYITITGSNVILDFSVTGAVRLTNPTNIMESTQPVEVIAGAFQFLWEAYPSTSDYVIEVMDANGIVVWGGFSNEWTVKNVVIPDSETSVVFNFDGSASGVLETGKVYRWRIYASKDDNQSATGWRLISVSEGQQGLIRIVD